MLGEIWRRCEGHRETHHPRHDVEGSEMCPCEGKSVQRREANCSPSLIYAQLGSDMAPKRRYAVLHWQRAAQEEQVPSANRLDIRTEWRGWKREINPQLPQVLFGTD